MDMTDLSTFNHPTNDPDSRDLDAMDLHWCRPFSLLDEFEKSLQNSKESADRAGMEPQGSILKVLPPETLTHISNFLDVGAIRSFRLVCRAFEKAAWPAFAQTFNDNIFFPTEKSLRALAELAENATFVPYLKQLKIGTIKVIPAGIKVTGDNMALLMMDYTNETSVPQNPAQLQWVLERMERTRLAAMLRGALIKLVCVETICMINWDDKYVDKWPSQLPEGASYVLWEVDVKAPRHALDIVYNAIGSPTTAADNSNFLPSLRNFKIEGRMPVSALPGCARRQHRDTSPLHPHCCLFLTRITHLDLAITNKLTQIDDEGMIRLKKYYLPDFLASMPNITNLSLQFDRPDYRIPRPYGSKELENVKEAFEVVANSVRLPRLEFLHLSYLGLIPSTPLLDFLFKHRTTLKSLKFTSLALAAVDWRPFTRFLSERIDLQEFTMASDMSPEERKISDAGWRRVPKYLEPKLDDYRRACRNGVRFVSNCGKEAVFKAEGTEQ